MISVIVPVYNCEKYITRCVESILKQSYSDYEIILVNDGSTDSSGDICDKLKSRDSRIHVIHKVNGGVSSARNAGLKNAQGDYIAFIDADDWVEPDYLEALIEPMLYDQDLDIVIMPSIDEELSRMVVSHQEFSGEKKYFREDEAILALLGQDINGIWAVWSKLYRKRLFLTLTFNELLCYGEDLVINIDLFLKALKIFYLPIRAYHYFHGNLESINNNPMNIDKWIQLLEVLVQKEDSLRIKNNDNMYELYCGLFLRFHRIIIELIFFYEKDYVLKLHYFYNHIGNTLSMILGTITQTHLINLKKKLQGSYEDCISMFDAIYNNSVDNLYIYGAGIKAKKLAVFLGRKEIKFKAFIISDGKKIEKHSDLRHPVIHLNELLASVNPSEISIFLAMKEEFVEEVLQKLSMYKFKKIFYL